MGIKSALNDPEARPIFYIPLICLAIIVTLLLIPPIGWLLLKTWFIFGIINIFIIVWVLVAGEVGFDGLVSLTMVASFIAGPISTLSILSVAVYFDIKRREESKRYLEIYGDQIKNKV